MGRGLSLGEDVECSEKIGGDCDIQLEIIDGAPVISLEKAIILYRKTLEYFPQWEELLGLPRDARIDESAAAFVGQLWEVSKLFEARNGRRRRGEMRVLPGKCDFDLWDVPVPCPDELRNTLGEIGFSRCLLELELATISLDLRKTIQPIVDLLSGTLEVDPESESVLIFKRKLFDVMRSVGIFFDN